jgi:hypothetical protein
VGLIDDESDGYIPLLLRRDGDSSDNDSIYEGSDGSIPPLLQRDDDSSDDDSLDTSYSVVPSVDVYVSYMNDIVFPSGNTMTTVWEENLCEILDKIKRDPTLDTHLGNSLVPILWGYLSGLIGVLLWVVCKVLCGFQELIDPVWRVISIPMFFVSTLMWDSLSLLLTPSGPVALPVSRKKRRSVARWSRVHLRDSSWSDSLFFGCAAWLVMSSCVMVPSHIHPSKSCDHPFSLITRQVRHTYRRIDALSSMVELSPGTFAQYQGIKGRKLWSDVYGPEDEVITNDVLHLDDYHMKTYRFVLKLFLMRVRIWILMICVTILARPWTSGLRILCVLLSVLTAQTISWMISSLVHFTPVHLQRIPPFLRGDMIYSTPPFSAHWKPLLTMEFFLRLLPSRILRGMGGGYHKSGHF